MTIAIEDSAATSGGSGDTVATPALNVATGQLIAVFVAWDRTQTVSDVSDTIGNTYTAGTQCDNNDGTPNVFCQWYWCISSGTNGSNVVTITFTGSSVLYSAAIGYVLSGVDGTTPVEDEVIADNTDHHGTATNTVSATASEGSMLLGGTQGCSTHSAITSTWSVPATEDFDVGSHTSTAHEAVSSGSYALSSTLSASVDWAAAMIVVKAAASGYTLTAASGTFAMNGGAASLEFGRVITAGSGNMTLTGQAAGLRRGYSLSAAAGAMMVSGTDVSLEMARVLSAGSGSIVMNGTDAALLYGAGYTVAADPASFVLAGADAGLKLDRVLQVGAGAYVIAGSPAGLSLDRALAASSGAFVLDGLAAGLALGRVVPAGTGTFLLVGDDASLLYGSDYVVAADSGSFELTGAPAVLAIGRTLPATAGVFDIVGQDVVFEHGYLLGASSGSLLIAGDAAALLFDRVLHAGAGVYLITGANAQLIFNALKPDPFEVRLRAIATGTRLLAHFPTARPKVNT